MKHEDFNFPQHGFAGHLAESEKEIINWVKES
jgi:hypothetical protein